MAGKDDDEEKPRPLRTNTAPELHPPGVARGGIAPRGAVGTGSQERESDFVRGPVYIEENGQLRGPYFMLSVDPHDVVKDRPGQAQEGKQDTSNHTHFHETSDDAVNRYYQAEGQVMVPDEEARAERQTNEEAERNAELDRIYAEARSEGQERDPDSDRYSAQNAQDQGQAREVDRIADLDRIYAYARSDEPDYERDEQDLDREEGRGERDEAHGWDDEDDRRWRNSPAR